MRLHAVRFTVGVLLIFAATLLWAPPALAQNCGPGEVLDPYTGFCGLEQTPADVKNCAPWQTSVAGKCTDVCSPGQSPDHPGPSPASENTCHRTCQPGAYVNMQSQQCIQCPIGTIATAESGWDSAAACAACPSGKKENPAQMYCVKIGACAWPQIYSQTDAAHPCVTCPAGEVAADGQGSCRTDCRGKGAYNPWTHGCDACTGATISNSYGTACIACTEGVPSHHAICEACEPGYAPNKAHSACVPCGRGQASSDGLTCVVCGPARGMVANATHTACVGPATHVVTPPLTVPTPGRPQGPVTTPGVRQINPGSGNRGPAGIGTSHGVTQPGVNIHER